MPVEQATYISELQQDWPAGPEPESQGDDHIRLLKAALQNTLPNLDGPVTGTPEQLNNVSLGFTFYSKDDENNTGYDHDNFYVANPNDTTQGAVIHGATPTVGELNTHITIQPTWENIQNLLYPVGKIIMSTKPDNPATYLGFGTWAARIGSIYGAGTLADADSKSHNFGVGPVSGHYHPHASQLWTDTRTLTMDAVPNHQHAFTTAKSFYGDSGHTAIMAGTSGTNEGSAAGGHTPKGTVKLGDATADFVTPGYAFYVWERTA